MEDHNIDPDRLRLGFSGIYSFLQEMRVLEEPPPGGAWHRYWRYLMQYPEMLEWERQWHHAQNELHQMVYRSVKGINTKLQVGRHVDAIVGPIDMYYRAGAPFSKMAGNNDFIKIITYHEIGGARLDWWYLTPWGETIYKGTPRELLLQWYYAQKGLDPSKNPDLKNLYDGLSPNFVYTETNRAVSDVNGKAAIYAGIGMDVPKGGGWGTEPWQSDPESVYEGTLKAFEAGGSGVVASREYEEITLESLEAYGNAVRKIKQ